MTELLRWVRATRLVVLATIVACAATGAAGPTSLAVRVAPRQEPAAVSDIAGPAFLAVSVRDLEASRSWYQQIFGVEPVRFVEGRDGQSRAIVMRRGNLVVELIAFDGSRSPDEMTPPPTHRFELQGLVKTGIFVVDAAAWHARLAGLGVDMDARVMTDDVLDMRTFVIRDPDGNRLQLFEHCDGPCSGIEGPRSRTRGH